MNNFFKNLIERHSQPTGIVKPRLPGVFEPDRFSSVNFAEPADNKFIVSKKEAITANTSPSKRLKNKVEEIKKEPVFQKNTISAEQKTQKLPLNNPVISSISENKSEYVQKSEQTNLLEKPVSRIRKEIQKNSEKNYSKEESMTKNQNSALNVFQIKPEIKQEFSTTHFFENKTEENNLTDINKNKKPAPPEKQFIPSEKKTTSVKNEQNGKTGMKLPERFNSWLSEPVKQTKPKGNEVSATQTIKVNIGRIEVRAIMDQSAAPVARKPAFKPKLSLEDYLNQRNGGKR